MTTGNDPYVEHLRGELSAVLDDVTPPAAPTAAVKRRGKAIRIRRRAGIAACVGVAVVAAALIPGLLRQSKTPGPITPGNKHRKVTVRTVGRGAPPGLIAQGAIGGKPWLISLSWQGKYLCVKTSGDLPQSGCGNSDSYAAGWPVSLEATGADSTEALYGTVANKVRRVLFVLSDDTVLNLRPVRFAGHRWIGLELPLKLAVTKVVAFSRSGELAYAIPFTPDGGLAVVEEWLRPGQTVPREFARLIGSGVSAGKRWSVTVYAGPWGQCAVTDLPGDAGDPRGADCWPPSRQPGAIAGSSGWLIAAARLNVSYLLLSMTDGTTRRVPTVQVGSLRFYAIVTIHGPGIARWAAYDASGHRLYGGKGAPSSLP